jgi:hypothetical protein
MKAILITVAAGIAGSLLATSSPAASINASMHNSKAALIDQCPQVVSSVAVATVAHELSARCALLSGHPVTITEAPSAQLASYSSKAVLRGERAVSIELAPLK